MCKTMYYEFMLKKSINRQDISKNLLFFLENDNWMSI